MSRELRRLAVGEIPGAGVSRDAVLEAKRGRQIRSLVEDEVQEVEDRVLRYTWSTETVDRAGDIVRQAWDLSAFARNPIALYNHKHETPIGMSPEYGVASGLDGPRLSGSIRFAPEGTDPFIDSRYKLAKAGIIRTTSVGFMPIEVDDVRDAKRRVDLGLGDWGVVFERSELLEISLAPVPMNPEAHQLCMGAAVQRGILTTDEAERYARELPPTERELLRALDAMGPSEDAQGAPERRVALVDIDELEERLGARVDAAIARALEQQITQPKGDASEARRQARPPGSGRGRAAEYLESLSEVLSAGAQPLRGKAKETPK